MSNAFTRGLRRLFGIKPKKKGSSEVIDVVSPRNKEEKFESFNIETISAKEGEVEKKITRKKTSKKKVATKKKPATKKKVAKKKTSKKKTTKKVSEKKE